MAKLPLIGVPCDRKIIGPHPFQAVGEKYVRALVDSGCGVPLLIPSLEPPLDLPVLLEQLDGIFLTGSYSNIEPHHYSDEPSWEGNQHDPHRDANTLPLVLPVLGAEGLPRGAHVRVRLGAIDEIALEISGTVVERLDGPVEAMDEAAEAEEDDELATPLALAIDIHETPGGGDAPAA